MKNQVLRVKCTSEGGSKGRFPGWVFAALFAVVFAVCLRRVCGVFTARLRQRLSLPKKFIFPQK